VFERYLNLALTIHPREFGALLRHNDGVIDQVAFIPQRSSVVTFNLDEIELARWRMQMDSEGEDLARWSAIIHTHPMASAYPSMPDLDQLITLARTQPALSLICGVDPKDHQKRMFLAHYARRLENGQTAIIKNIPVKIVKSKKTKTAADQKLAPENIQNYVQGEGQAPQIKLFGFGQSGSFLTNNRGQRMARIWTWQELNR
jgi:proteasome lid subunit RPN8/RPN11